MVEFWCYTWVQTGRWYPVCALAKDGSTIYAKVEGCPILGIGFKGVLYEFDPTDSEALAAGIDDGLVVVELRDDGVEFLKTVADGPPQDWEVDGEFFGVGGLLGVALDVEGWGDERGDGRVGVVEVESEACALDGICDFEGDGEVGGVVIVA